MGAVIKPKGRVIRDEFLTNKGYIRRNAFTAPLAANSTSLLNTASLDGSTKTTFVAQPDMARNISLVASGVTTANVVINGTDIRGAVITETIALNGGSAVYTLNAFLTVTSIVLPTVAATNVNVGISTALGLDRKMTENGVFLATVDAAADSALPTVTVSGTSVSLNKVTFATAPNATHNYVVYFVATELI